MAITRRVLGQEAPAATTDTDLYTVPAGTEVTAKVIVTNRGAATTFRTWVAIDGAATSNEQYIAYDSALAANETLTGKVFIANASDVVRVRSASGNVSFTITGIEQS